jgi:hypothetical protein
MNYNKGDLAGGKVSCKFDSGSPRYSKPVLQVISVVHATRAGGVTGIPDGVGSFSPVNSS